MQKTFRTYELALDLYKDCNNLRLKEPLRSQFERARLSIVLNLSEGSSRTSAKERGRFYLISLGSLREVQTILRIINHESLSTKADILGAHLYKLCKSLQNRTPN